MSETFTKLFSSITRSSIWLEDDQTLRVWVTMLALADRNGYVGASVGGLAALARVPRDKTQEALDKFLAPDPDSRSKDFDGRRIEDADRGWNILNYQRFRDMRDEEARKEYERQRKRLQRSKAVPDSPDLSRDVPVGPEMSRVSAHAEACSESRGSSDAESRGELEEKRAPSVLAGDPPSAAPARRRKSTALAKAPATTSALWDAYATAYRTRYGVLPVRNATVNGQLARFLGRLGGEEAPQVASWYLRSQNGRYVASKHAVGDMLRDAEKLRTEWATGAHGTAHSARVADGLAGRRSDAEELIEWARQRDAERAVRS